MLHSCMIQGYDTTSHRFDIVLQYIFQYDELELPDLNEVPEEINEKIPSTSRQTATHRLKRLQQPKRLPKLILKQKMGLVEYVYKDGESKNKIQNQSPLPKLIIKQKEGIVKVASHGTDSK